MNLSPAVLSHVNDLLAERLGLVFEGCRQVDLERGFLRACAAAAMRSPELYAAWLSQLPAEHPEWGRLARYLTVGETYFFRDPACFAALEHEVLPGLIAERRAAHTLRLRLWSAACATGEEPYSLAILLDRLLPDRADWSVTILATDINPDALEQARRGQYRPWALRETPRAIQDRYFLPDVGDTFTLQPTIRQAVTFAPLNLAASIYPSLETNTGAMDLVLCRNALMYFARETQVSAAARLQQAILPGGWLALSPAEASADLFPALLPVNFPGAIFFRRPLESHAAAERRPASSAWNSAPAAPPPPPTCPVSYPAAVDRTAVASPTGPREMAHVPSTALDLARSLADQGDLNEARRMCEAALVREWHDPAAQLLLATIAQEQGDLAAATEALRKAVYLDPDSPLAYFLTGSLLFRQDRRQEGRRALEVAVELLASLSRGTAVPYGHGVTAGQLLDLAREYLTLCGDGRATANAGSVRR
jgi:chemotaxis protein methyltransferase CheR